MEWLGVVLMVLIAALAAGLCDVMVRLLYIVAPPAEAENGSRQRSAAAD